MFPLTLTLSPRGEENSSFLLLVFWQSYRSAATMKNDSDPFSFFNV